MAIQQLPYKLHDIYTCIGILAFFSCPESTHLYNDTMDQRITVEVLHHLDNL